MSFIMIASSMKLALTGKDLSHCIEALSVLSIWLWIVEPFRNFQ